MHLEKRNLGVVGCFVHKSKTQLTTSLKAAVLAMDVTPVRNKFNREHGFMGWDCERFTGTIRSVPKDPRFNTHARQLIRLALKLAANNGSRCYGLFRANEGIVGQPITRHWLDRHVKPLIVS
jgi:hypothetical protein